LTLNDDVWRFIVEHRIAEAAPTVLKLIRGSPDDTGFVQRLEERVNYFEALSPVHSSPILYEALADDDSIMADIASRLIKRVGLARLDLVLALLDHPQILLRHRALNTLRVHQAWYTHSDIDVAKALLAKLQTTEWPLAEKQVIKGRFGKEKVTWRCVGCGTDVPDTIETCYHCQRDRRGFLQEDLGSVTALELIAARLDALQEIFPNPPQ